MIELAIVVVIMGIIAAIALPRLSSASENAARNAVAHDRSVLQRAIDLYTLEHLNTLPHAGAASKEIFVLRLLARTDENGVILEHGHLGPYLSTVPVNRVNGLATIRRDGAAPGANTHGWRYDTATGQIEPDHGAATGYKEGVITDAVRVDVTPDQVKGALKGVVP